MIFGVFLSTFIVISIINWLMDGKGSASGDSKGIRRGKWAVFFIFFAFFAYVFAWLVSSFVVKVYLCTLLILLFSGYIADGLSYFGLVREAYFFGQLNIFSLARNPRALDLYRAYKAIQRLPSQDKKQKELHWLHAQCFKQEGNLFSGQMIMFVIIEAQLTRPGDHQYLAQRLQLLHHIARASIPKRISLLASKLALAPAFAENDWTSIRAICEQWNTPAKNYLVKYLREFHGYYLCQERKFSAFRCWRYRMRLFNQPQVVSFAKQSLLQSKTVEKNVQQSSAKHMLTSTQVPLNQEQAEKIRNELTSETAQTFWMQRAAELGLKNATESWQKITESLNKCNKLKQESEFIEDEQQYLEVEQQHKKLFYVRSSIEEKINKDLGGPALPHFLDWLQVLHILRELQNNRQNQLQAFDRIHLVIWDWIADLWNIRKDRCLAHHIASECHSLAVDTGNNEFARVLSCIKSGRFR